MPGDYKPMIALESSTALALPPANNFASAYRKTPYRKLDLVADVLVPLCWAGITGLILGVFFAVLGLFLGWPGWAGPVAGLVITTAVWIVSMLSDRGLWMIEEITGRDLDGDGITGQPARRVVQVEVKEGKTTQLADLPGDADLVRFCQVVAAGKSFSEDTAQSSGYGVTNFRRLRDQFINRRWAFWRDPANPQQGVELTMIGKKVVNDVGLNNDHQ